MKSLLTIVLVFAGLFPAFSVAETVSPAPAISGNADLRPLSHRSSFDMRLAVRQITPQDFRINGVEFTSSSPRGQVSFGLGFSHWLKDTLTLTFAATAQEGKLEMAWDRSRGEFVESRGLVTLLVGLRQYVGGTPRVRPYLTAAVGPFIGGSSVTSNGSFDRARTESRSQLSMGGHLGGGVALRLGRSWMVDLSGGYNVMADFPSPISGHRNYNGLELGVGVSWLFGGGGGSGSE